MASLCKPSNKPVPVFNILHKTLQSLVASCTFAAWMHSRTDIQPDACSEALNCFQNSPCPLEASRINDHMVQRNPAVRQHCFRPCSCSILEQRLWDWSSSFPCLRVSGIRETGQCNWLRLCCLAGFPFLFSHMLRQRAKILGPKSRKQA